MCTILFYSMTNVHSLVAVCLQNADTAIHELYLHGGPRDNLHMSNSGIRKESSDQSFVVQVRHHVPVCNMANLLRCNKNYNRSARMERLGRAVR